MELIRLTDAEQDEAILLLQEARGHAIEWGAPYGGAKSEPFCRFCGCEYPDRLGRGVPRRAQDHLPALHESDCLLLRVNTFLTAHHGAH